MTTLTRQVAALLERAVAASEHPGDRAALADTAARLDTPLRVAIAGKVKAGKSTLLNALVGERLAPTDAGECTKIVTWYRDGSTYRVVMHPRQGEVSQVPFRRDDHALDIDLRSTAAAEVERLVVEWPSSALSEMTLIDTPGIDSVNTEISARTEGFLTPDDRPSSTDAVLYLMRHLHESDVRFLESFHDQVAAQPSAVNSIGVLSRADEIGVGRIDAMGSAKRIAERYSADAKVRRLCQMVTPVSGLLAETATTLTQEEFRQLTLLANAERSELDRLLVSVDRFAEAESPLGITPVERQDLLARFGIFGIRVAVALVRQGRAPASTDLAELLVERSGLATLRELLGSQFSARSEVLRCRSALLVLDDVIGRLSVDGRREVEMEFERIVSSTHEFAEVQLLSALRSGFVSLPGTDSERAERLLGLAGGLVHERLGGAVSSDAADLVAAAVEEHGYWRAQSENPVLARSSADAAVVLTRTCEGLIAGLHAVG